MRPQTRLPKAVGSHGIKVAKTGVRKNDGRRQSVEQGNFVRFKPKRPQFALAARFGAAIPMATSYVSAAPVTNAMRVAIPGSTLTRRRKLKIGSRTGPVVRDKRDPESNATGLAGVRPRPRNLIRSVSYSISLAETLGAEA